MSAPPPDGNAPRAVRRLRFGLGILQVFIAVGAVAGGAGFVTDPSGKALGMTVEWLAGTPFADYLVPGLVLLAVNGLLTLAGGILTFAHHRLAPELATMLGAFLMAWIVAQVSWIGFASWLQPLYFALGLLELILGWLVRRAARSA